MDSNITKAVIKAATAAKADKNAEDYYKDGVLVCGKCHTNKEKKIQLAGECVAELLGELIDIMEQRAMSCYLTSKIISEISTTT